MLRRNTIHKTKKKKKGQSTIEYVVLVAAVIAIFIIFLGSSGPFQQAYNDTLGSGTNGMKNMADRLSTSRPLSP